MEVKVQSWGQVEASVAERSAGGAGDCHGGIGWGQVREGLLSSSVRTWGVLPLTWGAFKCWLGRKELLENMCRVYGINMPPALCAATLLFSESISISEGLRVLSFSLSRQKKTIVPNLGLLFPCFCFIILRRIFKLLNMRYLVLHVFELCK